MRRTLCPVGPPRRLNCFFWPISPMYMLHLFTHMHHAHDTRPVLVSTQYTDTSCERERDQAAGVPIADTSWTCVSLSAHKRTRPSPRFSPFLPCIRRPSPTVIRGVAPEREKGFKCATGSTGVDVLISANNNTSTRIMPYLAPRTSSEGVFKGRRGVDLEHFLLSSDVILREREPRVKTRVFHGILTASRQRMLGVL